MLDEIDMLMTKDQSVRVILVASLHGHEPGVKVFEGYCSATAHITFAVLFHDVHAAYVTHDLVLS